MISEASKRSIKELEVALIVRGRVNIITDDSRKIWRTEIEKYERMV